MSSDGSRSVAGCGLGDEEREGAHGSGHGSGTLLESKCFSSNPCGLKKEEGCLTVDLTGDFDGCRTPKPSPMKRLKPTSKYKLCSPVGKEKALKEKDLI